LEALTDPITQIVKNSADHGLESAEQRAALGKPENGTITLAAYTRDDSAIIEVADDGGGIDTGTLKQKALELGIVTEEELSSLPDNEIYDLVFEPGVSTSKEITNLSGRGFGMNIVKTNIEKLGGSIEIESELGKGTLVRLLMPLTLSVIRALIVSIDSIQYAVPELNIERIVRISSETAAKRIERVNKSLVLVLDGRIIPIVTIKEIETKAKELEPLSPDEILERSRCAGVVKCLVLKAGGKNFAILIDNAIDTEQILVKPLPIFLQNCPCYSNVTVLGNGKAVTVLNAESIMRYMGLDDIEKEVAEMLSAEIKAEGEDAESEKSEKQIIIFNCSGPEYFAVEVEDVLRIEAIDPKDIQEIGAGFFVNIAGKTMRVVRPEDLAPVIKQSYTDKKLYVLTLKNSSSPLGLLAKRVHDKTKDVFTLDSGQLYSDFVFGTSVFNEKVIIFLNPAAIAEDIENSKLKRKVARKKTGII
jgi:two-component system chemotaxis sensor kinase CheA